VKSVARACGKIILLGEHAVVYGVPALAAGIDRGAQATARRAEQASLRLGDRRASADDGSDVGRAFAALLAELAAPPVAVEVELTILPGCGLGASAAISVAIARAVIEVSEPSQVRFEDNPWFDRVLAAATAWERVFHGNPSGIDAAAAAAGGCIAYTRGQGISRVNLAVDLELAIAVAGPPASTREMVEGLARLKERRPEVVNKSLEGIHALVRNAQLCIEAGDLVGLGKLMDLNQILLSGLFLSTEGIERACNAARDAGALGAKLTGSGGGGCVIALTDGNSERVLQAWRSAGFDCFGTKVERTSARKDAP
jgi:mevalonate kinase